MDFSLTPDQHQVQTLARRILSDHTTARHRRVQLDSGRGFSAELWQAFGEAGLLGVAVPAKDGGSGLSAIELCLVLEEQGRAAAPAPLVAHAAVGAMAIASFGKPIHRALLPDLVSGRHIITAALEAAGQPTRAVESAASPGQWRLSGTFDCVPALPYAKHAIVSARHGGDQHLFLIDDLERDGIGIEEQSGTHDDSLGRLTLEDATASHLAGPEARDIVLRHAHLGLAAVALGAAEYALMLTARYATERKQFDRPIGTFQAVSQRLGNAYIDVQAMRLTLYRAASLVAHGQPAAAEVTVARYWAAEGSHRVVTAAQHVHGGIGFDRSYPLYRYFLLSKQLEFTLGCASQHLEALANQSTENSGART